MVKPKYQNVRHDGNLDNVGSLTGVIVIEDNYIISSN